MSLKVDDFEILMSLYKDERPSYFKECIRSIEEDNQSPRVRLIIDGILTVELEDIIRNLNSDKWVIQRLKVNGGLARALNEGIQASDRQFLIRLDTDDLWVRDRCQFYINALKEASGEIDVIGGYAALIDDDSLEYDVKKVPLSHDDIIKSMWKCPFIHPSVAIRRDVLLSNPYSLTAGKRQDDYELWYRLRAENVRFANLNKVMVKYRYTYNNWRRNDIRVSYYRIKVLLRNERIGIFTIAVSMYLILRSLFLMKWVFLLDNKIKNLI